MGVAGTLSGKVSVFRGMWACAGCLLNISGAAVPGTGPIRAERRMRSVLRGPCRSAVKAAPHPGTAAPLMLSSSTAAQCPRNTDTFPERIPATPIRPISRPDSRPPLPFARQPLCKRRTFLLGEVGRTELRL